MLAGCLVYVSMATATMSSSCREAAGQAHFEEESLLWAQGPCRGGLLAHPIRSFGVLQTQLVQRLAVVVDWGLVVLHRQVCGWDSIIGPWWELPPFKWPGLHPLKQLFDLFPRQEPFLLPLLAWTPSWKPAFQSHLKQDYLLLHLALSPHRRHAAFVVVEGLL